MWSLFVGMVGVDYMEAFFANFVRCQLSLNINPTNAIKFSDTLKCVSKPWPSKTESDIYLKVIQGGKGEECWKEWKKYLIFLVHRQPSPALKMTFFVESPFLEHTSSPLLLTGMCIHGDKWLTVLLVAMLHWPLLFVFLVFSHQI